MRDEINQFPQRDNAGIRGGRRRGHENFAMRLILVVLGAEILDIRPKHSRALISTAFKLKNLTSIEGLSDLLGISANLVLQVRPEDRKRVNIRLDHWLAPRHTAF
jgi:phenylacetate-coenzyme A ligase PaaK-like adenylate-forming protein